MRGFTVEYTSRAAKQLRKLDAPVRRLIRAWIERNLVNADNPRLHGRALSGSMGSYWRYRVGDYRIVAEIRDAELVIIAVSIAHRSEVYAR